MKKAPFLTIAGGLLFAAGVIVSLIEGIPLSETVPVLLVLLLLSFRRKTE